MADVEYTVSINLDDLDLVDTPEEVGSWMVGAALRVWYGYDEESKFRDSFRKSDGKYVLVDDDLDRKVEFTAREFLAKHVELIWLGRIENYRHDWIEFAFKSNGVDADEYDDNTVDAVLQNMLYGEVVHG